jgi:hypothetical protein
VHFGSLQNRRGSLADEFGRGVVVQHNKASEEEEEDRFVIVHSVRCR